MGGYLCTLVNRGERGVASAALFKRKEDSSNEFELFGKGEGEPVAAKANSE